MSLKQAPNSNITSSKGLHSHQDTGTSVNVEVHNPASVTVMVTITAVEGSFPIKGSVPVLVPAVQGVEGVVGFSAGVVVVRGAVLVFMVISVFANVVVVHIVSPGFAVSNSVEVIASAVLGARVVDLASADLSGSRPLGARWYPDVSPEKVY
ncbi:hypothetical protein LZ30DRAFT_687933 [Colletotrichum cereale]|nr:hypothetical protein LZ30DRAFT_687933 [Colletotrichum cereale]